jgi:hypothetical protein
MKSSELDYDAKYTLALLANRDAIDPKRHYRCEKLATPEPWNLN